MRFKPFSHLHPDFCGFILSFACAVHCFFLPFMLSLGGLGSLFFIQSKWAEDVLLLGSLFLALFSLLPSYRKKHKQPQALLLMGTGILLILLSKTFLPEEWESWWAPAGTCLLALAHYTNWRLLKKYTA